MQTPKDHQPSSSVLNLGRIEEAASWELPSNFFIETEPSQWLPEKFYDAGYTDIGAFLESLAVLSKKRTLSFGIRSFCSNLLEYLVSLDGRTFLDCLATSRSITIEETSFQSKVVLQALRSANKTTPTDASKVPANLVSSSSSSSAPSLEKPKRSEQAEPAEPAASSEIPKKRKVASEQNSMAGGEGDLDQEKGSTKKSRRIKKKQSSNRTKALEAEVTRSISESTKSRRIE
ncbi:hypothetical protein BGZ65_011373, partial [Modicella reniformis]